MTIAESLDLELPRASLGEGAHWDGAAGRLFWVDIAEQRFHVLDVKNGVRRSYHTSRPVSFVFPASPSQVWLGLANGVYLRDLDTDIEQIVAHLVLPADHRFNDGKCDPRGRLWIGTINTADDGSETAALYKLEDGAFQEVEGGYVNVNGKAWSRDGHVMYHADTNRGVIWQYDYDVETASITNKRVFANLGDANPDGLTADSEGNIYAALYGGSAVTILSPRGDEIGRIELSVPNPTSCAFGGDDMRTLFITTASDGMDEDALRRYPYSGQVFAAGLDVPGVNSPSPTNIAGAPEPEDAP